MRDFLNSLADKLKELILSRALKVAEEPIFKLSSGKLSRYYRSKAG